MEKENVKVLVEYNGETYLYETPLAIMAFKTDEGSQVAFMGSGNIIDIVGMKSSLDQTVADFIKDNPPVNEVSKVIGDILQNILDCDGDCENCEKESEHAEV